MSSRQLVLGLLGGALMAWGGAHISTRLGGSTLTTVSVLAFALGVFCFCLMALVALSSRVAKLERALTNSSSGSMPLR